MGFETPSTPEDVIDQDVLNELTEEKLRAIENIFPSVQTKYDAKKMNDIAMTMSLNDEEPDIIESLKQAIATFEEGHQENLDKTAGNSESQDYSVNTGNKGGGGTTRQEGQK